MVLAKGPTLFFFACGYPVFPRPFVEKSPFPIEWSWDSFQKSFDHVSKGLFLDSVLVHWFICLSLCLYHTILINVASQ